MSMADRYRDALLRLLPQGTAWVRVPGSDLFKLMSALACELARVDQRAKDLLEERDPRTATELLPDWERLLDLPGECLELAVGPAARRGDIHQRLTAVGGQSKAYFEQLAATVGFNIEVKDYRDIPGGVAAASFLTPAEQLHTWVIISTPESFQEFKAGHNAVGERLRTFGEERIQCFFEQVKPAHTYVVYTYIEGP